MTITSSTVNTSSSLPKQASINDDKGQTSSMHAGAKRPKSGKSVAFADTEFHEAWNEVITFIIV